jgi:hypothetical protein
MTNFSISDRTGSILSEVDKKRGSQSRSTFILEILERALKPQTIDECINGEPTPTDEASLERWQAWIDKQPRKEIEELYVKRRDIDTKLVRYLFD